MSRSRKEMAREVQAEVESTEQLGSICGFDREIRCPDCNKPKLPEDVCCRLCGDHHPCGALEFCNALRGIKEENQLREIRRGTRR